jgi:hypothetical protein
MNNLHRIDELLRSHVKSRWQKVAMVIGETMLDAKSELAGIDDSFLAERVRQLVKTGVIESRGDLDQIRYSEIRSIAT